MSWDMGHGTSVTLNLLTPLSQVEDRIVGHQEPSSASALTINTDTGGLYQARSSLLTESRTSPLPPTFPAPLANSRLPGTTQLFQNLAVHFKAPYESPLLLHPTISTHSLLRFSHIGNKWSSIIRNHSLSHRYTLNNATDVVYIRGKG
jgi:hypothetical protein